MPGTMNAETVSNSFIDSVLFILSYVKVAEVLTYDILKKDTFQFSSFFFFNFQHTYTKMLLSSLFGSHYLPGCTAHML